jgi:predicted nucleic acid-binding protein
MAIPRRLWDSDVILAYLGGDTSLSTACDSIIRQAEQGKLEIAVSAITQAEVAYLKGTSDDDSEAKILEFFSRKYIVPIAYETKVAGIARGLIRKYSPGFKPFDAIHLATALLWHIPLIETKDKKLISLSGKEGNPTPIIIRLPQHKGTATMFTVF